MFRLFQLCGGSAITTTLVMRTFVHICGLAVAVSATNCAGCGPLEGEHDNARFENGGTPSDWDANVVPDAGGGFERSDASGHDNPQTTDSGVWDAASLVDDAAGEVDAPADVAPPGPVCGDGIIESPETCDDGVTGDCTGTHDGGDGTCVTAGTCAADYVFDGTICVPAQVTQHVHIYVANDCSMMVDPPELTIPQGQTVRFEWHNHSQFYAVDVWQSYIGGFTDLAPGMTWNETFEWCFNVNPYTGYSDITTNEVCPSHRFMIYCNGR